MKVRLTENQLNTLTTYLFEDTASNFYGLKVMLNNLNVGDKLAISTNDPIELGRTIELSVDTEDKVFKLINVKGTILTLQNTKNKMSPRIDFKDFDNGRIQAVKKDGSGEMYDVTSIKRIVSDKVVAIYRPKSHDPEQQAKDDETEVNEQTKAFIKKLASIKNESNFVFKGEKEIEFKKINSNDKGVELKPISSEVKTNNETITIPFDEIKFDKGTREVTLKYYDGQKSTILSGINGINEVKGSPNSDDKGEPEEDVSEELQEMRDLLTNLGVGQTFKLGEYEFVVTKEHNQSNGVGFRPSSKKAKEYILNILKRLNEEKDTGTEFFIRPNLVIQKGDKINITATMWHKSKMKDFNLGTFPIDLENMAGEFDKGEEKVGDGTSEEENEEKFNNILESLKTSKDGDIITFDGVEFIKVKNYNTKKGQVEIVLKPKDSSALKFIKSKINEDKNKILDKYQFRINLNKIKRKGDKISIPLELGGKIYKIKSSLDDFKVGNDAMGDRFSKKKKEISDEKKREEEKKKRREKEKLDKQKKINMKKAVELIKDNPRLIRAIKKGIVPAKEVLKRVEKRIGGDFGGRGGKESKKEKEEWLSKFKTRNKVFYDIEYIEDKSVKSKLNLSSTGNIISISGKDDNKVVLVNKQEKYKIFISKRLSKDEYGGELRFVGGNGRDKNIKIEILITDYNKL